jgi:hypothetical protein
MENQRLGKTIERRSENMNKEKIDNVFGKDIYLLGVDVTGVRYWLESPSWDCGWYWGFGYIETYTNNKYPQNSKDISSHQHATNFMSEYFVDWNGSKPVLKDKTFSDKEGWELSELFQQFYLLRDMAEYFKNGKSNCGSTLVPDWKKPELVKEINEIRIPMITRRILDILTPDNKKEG